MNKHEVRRVSRARQAGITLMAITVMMAFGGIAGAVHSLGVVNTGLFELGPSATSPVNATTATNIIGGQAAGPDWNDVCANDTDGDIVKRDTNGNTIPDAIETLGADGLACIDDDLSVSGLVDDTVFAESNKNGDDINTWNWDTGNSPVKDDLSNVYGYAVEAGGDLVIYAGLERLSPNGDSHVDIEFTQEEVVLDKDAPCGDDESADAADGSPCEFFGARTENDLIVSLDYTNGGALGSLEVRKWDGNNYEEVVQLNGSGCNVQLVNGYTIDADAVCGFTNTVAVNGGDWDNYDSHAAVITNLPTNAFAEFGVNVNEVFDLAEPPCFSTINAHTRSSQSFTAELKDFAAATFELCAPSTSVSASADSTLDGTDYVIHDGDDVVFTYNETNDGIDDLYPPLPGDASPTQNDGNGGWIVITDGDCSPVLHVLGESNDADPAGDGGTPASDENHNVGDLNNDNVLNPQETWTFTCTDTDISQTETQEVIAHGIDKRFDPDVDVTYCTDGIGPAGTGLNGDGEFCDAQERALITINVINPGTHLFKTAQATITFRYYETNEETGGELSPPGSDALPSSFTDTNGGWVEDDTCTEVLHVLGEDDAGTTEVDESDYNVGDTDADNLLDGGETWVFICEQTTDEGEDIDQTNTATGHGDDSLGFDVTWCEDPTDPPADTVCDQDEQDSVDVTITHNAPNPVST